VIRTHEERERCVGAMSSKLDAWFTYHAATPEQAQSYEAIRRAARELAEVIVYHTPGSADQTAALRKVREAVMTANAAIACGGV
jgi:hypothetical protein